ncbi:hypothetical protein A3F00_02270 [Candidatus Daviesbacteria bacterium RIFCSPHIGHO2_12_FULL_37_11]|uniref:Uncharacterized protein n=1 Tax=Candidatus Daviesbacteria bacterium RIFCSPHIGHO2_12_FULL_37_11 TaxID=1797777 RepID=A0A1F5KD27_9BACT|nr:MAG: hypothetical protein A3F00_02270 [Candidatus Daviesbacteria bacterium RIFCSPHIGHO2_12_FULL_37_11]OGE46077.1 MAG: hypothetical protein A3B39_03675 [Candidatus Daviesbacteria bacterium RIFCSPLOWO2_01_FULL_37_10]
MVQSDRLAEFDFSKEDTLIFGATNGFGRVLAVDLRKKGVERIGLGTTSLTSDHFLNTMAELKVARPGLGEKGLIAVKANLTDQEQIDAALDVLPFNPKHVFMLPATGMQFAKESNKHITKLQRIKNRPQLFADPEAERNQTLLEFHQNLDVQLPRYLRESLLMNVAAPVQTVEALIRRYPDGFTLTYLDSTFGDKGRGPRYYTNVLTKHAFDIWLSQNGRSYARRGIDTARIIAPAILGTEIGDYLTEEIIEVEDPEVAALLTETAVDPEDIFIPIYEFMSMTREERAADGVPYERYVTRYNGISNDRLLFVGRSLPEGLEIDPNKYQL